MEAKKSPKADLRNKRRLFFQIGMVVTLMLMIGVFSSSQTEKRVLIDVIDPAPPIAVDEPPLIREPPKVEDARNIVFDPQIVNIVDNNARIDVEIDFRTFVDDLPIPEPYNKPETEVDDGAPIILFADEMPMFQGGDLTKFRNWVFQNIVYPQLAIDTGTQGRVTVTFVIERDGSLTNIEVLSSPDRSLSEEAVRVLKKSPQWQPGKNRNTPVRIRYNLPLDFQLQ